MILVDDNLRFISLIRFNEDDTKFYDLTKADFDDKFSFENNITNFIVI
jgi:hypothetical protein